MKDFFLKALVLFTFLAGNVLLANAQDASVTLVVTKTNGEEQAFQLTENSQLYFENGERLVIDDGGNNTVTFQLAEIRKLVCTDYTGIGETAPLALQMMPNPTRDRFLIQQLQNSGEARIYTLDGRLVKSFTATEGLTVDISDLAPGMYLLHIDGQTLKMMKL